MVLNGLKIALLCFALSGCADRAAAVAVDVVGGVILGRVGDTANKPKSPPITDELVCERATLKGKWETRDQFQEYVKEAEKRKLTCGVDKGPINPKQQQALFPSLPF
jgi:hypothetical protein